MRNAVLISLLWPVLEVPLGVMNPFSTSEMPRRKISHVSIIAHVSVFEPAELSQFAQDFLGLLPLRPSEEKGYENE